MTTSTVTTVAPDSEAAGGIATALFAHLEEAWNDADGRAFADAFVDDTEFVDARGGYHHGADEVRDGHQALFDSIYAGSEVRYRVSLARTLASGVVVAVVAGVLDCPSGPLAGTTSCRITATIVERAGRWAIVAFHNTIVVEVS